MRAELNRILLENLKPALPAMEAFAVELQGELGEGDDEP
jgi:hypothetical protein